MSERWCSVLLRDAKSYQLDLVDLNTNKKAAAYWFPLFRDLINRFAKKAASSQVEQDATATERAENFRKAINEKIDSYEQKTDENAAENKVLGTRELLELNEIMLRSYGFPDPWLDQKQQENAAATRCFKSRLRDVDAIENADDRWTELVRGVLAGNMFDWGAQESTRLMEKNGEFGLNEALRKIQPRPWLMDDLDRWLERMREGRAHKCAVIFVDNSGTDIILGILPFARELLKRDTRILLAANSEPSLNDVTSAELIKVLNKCRCDCPVLDEALATNRLLVYGNGQRGPCLDMRTLPDELSEAIRTNETDLLVIEGMGRALHTNLYAKFNCETLKLAVIKNTWIAEYLGGTTFDVMCKYERS